MSAANNTKKTGRRAGAKWELWGFLLIIGGACIYPVSETAATAAVGIGFVVFIIGRFK